MAHAGDGERDPQGIMKESPKEILAHAAHGSGKIENLRKLR
jgi:hypothetical protein